MGKWKFTMPDGTAYTGEGETEDEAYAAVQEQATKDVRDEYGHLPWYQKPVGAAADIMRIISNVPFSAGDRLTSYMEGTDLEKERYETEKSRQRAGSATIPAEMLPAMAFPAFRAGSIPGNLAIGAGEGALYGGGLADAHGEDPVQGAIEGLLTGGAVGAGGQLLKRTLKAAPRVAKKVGVGIANEVGKMGIKEGMVLGGGLEGLSHLATNPISTSMAVGAGATVPIVGALARAVANPSVRKAVRDAAKEASKRAKENPEVFFEPPVRQGLTATGILAKDELKKKNRGQQ